MIMNGLHVSNLLKYNLTIIITWLHVSNAKSTIRYIMIIHGGDTWWWYAMGNDRWGHVPDIRWSYMMIHTDHSWRGCMTMVHVDETLCMIHEAPYKMRATWCNVTMPNDSAWCWYTMMIHCDYTRWIYMMVVHDDGTWWLCIMMIHDDDTWWWSMQHVTFQCLRGRGVVGPPLANPLPPSPL